MTSDGGKIISEPRAQKWNALRTTQVAKRHECSVHHRPPLSLFANVAVVVEGGDDGVEEGAAGVIHRARPDKWVEQSGRRGTLSAKEKRGRKEPLLEASSERKSENKKAIWEPFIPSFLY